MTTDSIQTDIVIVGGGLVGASLAVSLIGSGLRVVVIEPYPLAHTEQPSYNERTVALTWSARQIYTGMGVWQQIAERGAEPITDIHVSSKGQFGMTHLHASDVGTEALGYVVPTRVLGSVLNDQMLVADNIVVLENASAEGIETESDRCQVRVKHEDRPLTIEADLAVLADGGRSGIGSQFAAVRDDYTEQALLTFVTTDQPHCGRAYERFTDEGPLAMLPHSNNRYAVVWTTGADNLQQRMQMDDKKFLAELQHTFGDRAGTFSHPAPRIHYPLGRLKLDDPVSERCVVIGNAAHTVHPVAGQGFNLGLRDVAALAGCIADSNCAQQDIGAAEPLRRYADSRKHDTSMVRQFTHGLISLFTHPLLPVRVSRSALLHGIEQLPAVKRLLLRRTMGLTADSNPLTMGLPLFNHTISSSNEQQG